jgi:hypothetical protein
VFRGTCENGLLVAGRHALRPIALRSLLVLLLPGTSCLVDYRPIGPVVIHTHPNGIVLRLPKALDAGRGAVPLVADRTADGFRVGPPRTHAVRWADVATVAFRPASALPEGNHRTRRIGARTIHYAVVRQEGGSCGDASVFTGWERCGDRVLQYEQTMMDECGGDLGLVWLVIEGTSAGCGG